MNVSRTTAVLHMSAVSKWTFAAVSRRGNEYSVRPTECCVCVNAGRHCCPRLRMRCTVRPVKPVVRIRVCLADRAGALGQVATVIGLHGGNILSVDVHSTDSASAVDDLVVEFQAEPSNRDLGTDLSTTAAATIVQMEPAESVDVVTAVLDALSRGARTVIGTGEVSAQAGEAGLELTESLATVCPATDWSIVDQTPGDPGLAESDVRRPQLVVPIPGSANALLGRRAATIDFTATEKARVDAVVRLWECMTVTGMK